MDYKKIIKSKSARGKILRALSFIPDKPMLKIQYWIKMGRRLHLKHPRRYTEKVQWYKLYYKDPVLVECVDKYDVRDYIARQGFEKTLTKCYGVYESLDAVDFGALPEKFVAKATIGGGGNAVILVPDKSSADLEAIRKTMKRWLEIPTDVKRGGREWPYYCGKKNRIIIEEFLESKQGEPLVDYKFFCFREKIVCVYVIGDRTLGGHGKLAVVDRDFKRLEVQSTTQEIMENDPEIPENFEEMAEIVEKLAKPFPHVRVDMYNIDGRIYFGELTFYGASGYQTFIPDAFDFTLGKEFILPEKKER